MILPDTRSIEARSNAADMLIHADEPLAILQIRCGGTIPGAIAVPELRELVGKARAFGLKLAHRIMAQDGADIIRAWAEVTPLGDGCHILLRRWQISPPALEGGDGAERYRFDLDRALAEFTAHLDAGQGVLSAQSEAPELDGLARAVMADPGRHWTDFVIMPGHQAYASLHWRLLDGVVVGVEGSARPWRVTLIPQMAPGDRVLGFELCLNSEVPPPPATPPVRKAPARARTRIGHELAPILRQPIGRIIANADAIRTRRAGPLAADYAAYACDIAAAGQHLLGLVEDLTDVEAIEAQDFGPASEAIDLVDAARRAAAILGMRAREKGITLTLVEDGPVAAVGEFRRVVQILLNLVGNAIRYGPAHSVITLQVLGMAGRARATITDEGQGLSAQERARVFDKFERLGRRGDGGTGLGLYISRKLARAMGGDLMVESEPGQGTCFTLDLPGNS